MKAGKVGLSRVGSLNSLSSASGTVIIQYDPTPIDSNQAQTQQPSTQTQTQTQTQQQQQTQQPRQTQQQQTQTQQTQQTQQTTTTTNPPSSTPPPIASNFDMFHPVVYNVVGGSGSYECTVRASDIAGYNVTCTLGGGCNGANPNHYGACFLAPVEAKYRTDASMISMLYSNADGTFPQGFAAAQFLKQLYINVLNRQPDVGGFYYWLNDYFNGKASVPSKGARYLADAIIKSSENQNYILANVDDNYRLGFLNEIYRGLLGREADADGLYYWLNDMRGGVSADIILEGFYNSSEFQSKTSGF